MQGASPTPHGWIKYAVAAVVTVLGPVYTFSLGFAGLSLFRSFVQALLVLVGLLAIPITIEAFRIDKRLLKQMSVVLVCLTPLLGALDYLIAWRLARIEPLESVSAVLDLYTGPPGTNTVPAFVPIGSTWTPAEAEIELQRGNLVFGFMGGTTYHPYYTAEERRLYRVILYYDLDRFGSPACGTPCKDLVARCDNVRFKLPMV